MRRISVFLALAAFILFGIVGCTYYIRESHQSHSPAPATPKIDKGYDAVAHNGWSWDEDDPQTNKPVVRVTAKSFRAAHNPSTFELRDVALKLYNKTGNDFTYVKSGQASFDEFSGVLKSEGPVSIIMKVPDEDDPEDPSKVAKLIHVSTSEVTYETKTGKADTAAPAEFQFAEGKGHAVGVSYDPNTGDLHLKANVAVDLTGHGTAATAMHIEAGDLVYKEREQRIYLSPWSKLKRQNTQVSAQTSVIVLQDQLLREIDSAKAVGSDTREAGRTDFSADQLVSLYDEDGVMTDMVGTGSAKILSTRPTSKTAIHADRADLRFGRVPTNKPDEEDNLLQTVLADGHANLQSDPIAAAGKAMAESRFLRSDHIQLHMASDGKEIKEVVAPDAAVLEFKPNRPDQAHRMLNASRLRIEYGEGSYIDGVYASDASTRTEKPANQVHTKDGSNPPALTWSDQLVTKFQPGTNQVARIEQTGHFRYQEGVRKSKSDKAVLEQNINRITLEGAAQVADDTGTSNADEIVMNQSNGDMDAIGRVYSTRAPDKNQKPGTSMLDATKTMQAKADLMKTRDNNMRIDYSGHAVLWQGANRISANTIDIDRDEQVLHASGDVVSELVDNKSNDAPNQQPVFTVVRAPEMTYHDADRVALYSGGVKLTRGSLIVSSKELRAFLTPNNGPGGSGNSSLDHAFADGDVKVLQTLPSARTREGQSDHGEYYTKDDKVVLNGGSPQMVDSYKGITRGQQLTYFSDDDRLIVEGKGKDLAYTRMRKR